MAEQREQASWVHSTAGVILVNGVLTAVVSAVATWAINNAASLPWAAIVATFLAVAVGLFFALSLILTRLRDAVWRRPARWLWMSRPVSARRHARELAELGASMSDLAKRADRAIDQVRSSIPDVALVLSTQINDRKTEIEGLRQELERRAPHAGPKLDLAANAKAALGNLEPKVSKLPAPEPRWQLTQGESGGGYFWFTLSNLIPGSVALNVRLDSGSAGSFSFQDAAFWPDLSGESSGRFIGRPLGYDENGDCQLRLTYLDDNHRPQKRNFWLSSPAPPVDDTPF